MKGKKYILFVTTAILVLAGHETQARGKETAIALKTNLVRDVAWMPNIGLELPVGCHLSVNTSYRGAWWEKTADNFCLKTYGGDLGIRYWIEDNDIHKKLSGHHIGLYAHGYTYDLCLFPEKGIQAPRPNWGASLEYGYSFPMSENLYLEASIGAGALWGQYHVYRRIDDHFVWQATKDHCYFGPTMMEFSIVYHFHKKAHK